MILHICLSVIAAACLTLAAFQSVLLAIQERLLHLRQTRALIDRLPPLQTMEQVLFRLITVGFIFLSGALLSGLWFIENWFAQHLVNKTVLSISAWVIFGVLLWGRRRYGWRGQVATRWVLTGYGALVFAYFGSKYFLDEIINKTVS